MAGALEDLAKTLDLQPADILSAFTGLRAAVPIYMGLGATGLNAGEDEQLRRIYGPLPPTPVPRETPEMEQRRMIADFEQRFPTPELRRAVIEQMRANRREGRFDPSTATRRADFAPHAQPEYKGPVMSPSTGKRKFQAGGKVVKSSIQKAKDLASSDLWHGGTYKRGDIINKPLYLTPLRDMAQSYVDAKDYPGATLQRLKPNVSRPAPERLVKAAARRHVPENAEMGYTPASAFDTDLHDRAQIEALIRELERRGYDSAQAGDIGMPSLTAPASAGDALVVFPGKQAYQAGGKVAKKTAQQMADEMLVRGTKTAQREPVNLSRRSFFGLPESKSMPLAKIDDTALDKLEKKYAREGQAPALTERTTTVSPDAGKTQSTLRSIVETPVSRREVLKSAGSQALQGMLPMGDIVQAAGVPTPYKMLSEATGSSSSPLLQGMPGMIAAGLREGMSEDDIVRMILGTYRMAEPTNVERTVSSIKDPASVLFDEPVGAGRAMMDLIGAQGSPVENRGALRYMRKMDPSKYDELKQVARDISEYGFEN